MAKLHEAIAARPNLEAQATSCRTDLGKTFSSKGHHFEETLSVFRPVEENQQEIVEKQSELQTTVPKELAWITRMIGPAIDVDYQIAHANTQAKADIVLKDDTVLATGVPVAALLDLEKRLNEVLDLAKKIPTLDPSKGYKEDPERGKGIWRSKDERRERTKKVQTPLVLYPATPEHPAQTQIISQDVLAGYTTTTSWSGALSVAQKGDMLERIEAVRVAVSEARSRANDQEVDTRKQIAYTLLNYCFGQQ